MKILDSFKSLFVPEKKSTFNYSSFVEFLYDAGHTDLGDFISIDLYSKVAPLATAVNLISDGVAGLVPVVKDKDDNIVEHPVLTLIANPNADQTKVEFLKRFASFFIICGDNFTIANGQVNKPPLELVIPSTQAITMQHDTIGKPGLITVTNRGGAFNFVRDERWRFYDGPLRECWHTKTFNPNVDALRGQSILTPIWHDIEQYKHSSMHNLSILKRGARPSGVFTSKDALTDDQYTRLKDQIDKYFTGSSNAGRPLLADGGEMAFTEMMQTARDMDFLDLKKNVTMAIFNQLKIPLPLVSDTGQTYDNMAAANLQLYDNAIMPLADRIFEELTLFLMPRYKSDGLRITYDKSEIEALDTRKTRTLESRSKLGIYTINELRTIDGMEAVEDGDVVLRPASDLPIATDRYTQDQLQKPATRSKFFDIMKKNSDMSDEELNGIANRHGLN